MMTLYAYQGPPDEGSEVWGLLYNSTMKSTLYIDGSFAAYVPVQGSWIIHHIWFGYFEHHVSSCMRVDPDPSEPDRDCYTESHA